MPHPADHDARLARARLALAGLSLGDAFGQRFFFREGWAVGPKFRQLPPPEWNWTDDTAMAIGVLQVLDRHGGIDQDDLAATFARNFSRDPSRGYGGGAVRILLEIGKGAPWRAAAASVFRGEGSMGNGSAMRIAPLAGYFADDLDAAAEQARLSAEVTHRHPEGIFGGIAAAVAGAWAWQRAQRGGSEPPSGLFDAVLARTPESVTRQLIAEARELPLDAWEQDAAGRLGNGERVTCPDTVPLCLWAAARHLDDFEEALWTTVKVGGDVDTNAAIVGGIVALSVGAAGIPPEWVRRRERLPLIP